MLIKKYPERPQTIGGHIRRRRLDLGLLQKEVAKKIGVHFETLKNWERGVGQPLVRHMPRIAKFLGYDPEPIPETFPSQVVYVRRRLGYTQDEFAKVLHVDQVTIWHWEHGNYPALEANLKKVLKLMATLRIGKNSAKQQ